jgi:hypothetical protein
MLSLSAVLRAGALFNKFSVLYARPVWMGRFGDCFLRMSSCLIDLRCLKREKQKTTTKEKKQQQKKTTIKHHCL